MALSPRLEFRQTQSLTMTPQLLQSIRLLQLSHLELNEFVDAELLSNPLLERSEATDTDASAPEPEIVPSATSAETDLGTGEHLPDATAIAETYDTAVENLYPDQGTADRPQPASRLDRDGASASGEAPDLDQYVAARPTLSAHLEEQASFLLRTPADRLIAQHLIHGLDDTGYLHPRSRGAGLPAGHRGRKCRSGALGPAGLRAAGGICPLGGRMPGVATGGARPPRPADAGAAGPS